LEYGAREQVNRYRDSRSGGKRARLFQVIGTAGCARASASGRRATVGGPNAADRAARQPTEWTPRGTALTLKSSPPTLRKELLTASRRIAAVAVLPTWVAACGPRGRGQGPSAARRGCARSSDLARDVVLLGWRNFSMPRTSSTFMVHDATPAEKCAPGRARSRRRVTTTPRTPLV
jgi:hypothetical protein